MILLIFFWRFNIIAAKKLAENNTANYLINIINTLFLKYITLTPNNAILQITTNLLKAISTSAQLDKGFTTEY